jgi:RHS repeat-associated protein
MTIREDNAKSYPEVAMDYSPYGGIMWKSNRSEKQRDSWVGKEKDRESGLGDHGVRKYDHITGRFNSIDPLWSNYIGWNPYQYSRNNPIMRLDINGLNDKKNKTALQKGIEGAIFGGLTNLVWESVVQYNSDDFSFSAVIGETFKGSLNGFSTEVVPNSVFLKIPASMGSEVIGGQVSNFIQGKELGNLADIESDLTAGAVGGSFSMLVKDSKSSSILNRVANKTLKSFASEISENVANDVKDFILRPKKEKNKKNSVIQNGNSSGKIPDDMNSSQHYHGEEDI